MDSQYYIARGQGTRGPFSFAELQTYLAYGSIGEMDLVSRDGVGDWMPMSALPEFQEADAPTSSGKAGKGKKPVIRRRTARYREYDRVPVEQRSGTTAKRILFGLLLWPPTLWKAGATLFTSYIYRKAKDDSGYLKIWPRWVEPVVSVLIVVNVFAWICGAAWVSHKAAPILREVVATMRDSTKELETWISTEANP